MRQLFILLFGISTFFLLVASKVQAPLEEANLFTSHDPLEITLKTDLNALFKDREDERSYHPAQIQYTTTNGESLEVPLKIKVRGNFRRKGGICRIPPLRLNFAKKTVAGSVFEGQDKIKLVTHCQKSPTYEQYLLQEYLVYRVYNILTDFSFRVRLVKINYEDESGKWKPMSTYAFMIEDEDEMARRLGGKLQETKGLHPLSADEYLTTLLSVFEYSMGNTDWSIFGLHNVKILVREPIDPVIAIPYDFDWCGIVNTPYAKPNELLSIPNVRTRVYRGFKRSDETFRKVFDKFNEHKTEIMTLYETCEGLDKKQKKQAMGYLEDFYRTINTEKLVQRNIINAARSVD